MIERRHNTKPSVPYGTIDVSLVVTRIAMVC